MPPLDKLRIAIALDTPSVKDPDHDESMLQSNTVTNRDSETFALFRMIVSTQIGVSPNTSMAVIDRGRSALLPYPVVGQFGLRCEAENFQSFLRSEITRLIPKPIISGTNVAAQRARPCSGWRMLQIKANSAQTDTTTPVAQSPQ
jgi:hypothetical protein